MTDKGLNASIPTGEPIVFILSFKCIFSCTYEYARDSMHVHVSGSMVLSFYLVIPWHQNEVISLGSNYFI